MNVKCLGTGSSGNAYALTDNNGKILLLDCGLSIKEIKAGIDFRVSDIVGCVVTHDHSDHSKAADDLKHMGIPVARPYMESVVVGNYGDFIIRFFRLDDSEGHFVHSNADGSECPIYGYMIMHDKEPLKLLYITDCQFIKWRFKDVTNLIIGIDYADELVPDDNRAKQLHIYSGHLNIDNACDFIKVLDRDKTLKNVIVGHMSSTASDRNLFSEKLIRVTESDIYFAHKGLVVDL